MKTLLTLLLLAASAFGQTATIGDTIRTPFGGTFSGTVTVSLNSPALAQPLYSGNVTLSGWTQAVTVTAGVFTLTLYTNDLITPGGTSYTATYAPTSGSGWKETWIVPTGATTIREIRSTTVPSPSVRFTPSQITQAGATLGQGLKWDGSKWAPADVVANPMTTNGDLITRLGGVPVRVGIGSTNQVLTVSGGMPVWASGITGNASTATALAANGTNCSAGSYPLGVDASGNAESCTAAVTASTGLSDSSALVRNNQANAYTAGNKQTFASNATTAGAAFGGGITADPSSVSAGDFWYRTDLGTFGFRNATAVDALVAGGRALTAPGSVPFVTSSGVLGQSANLFWDNANGRLGVGTNTPSSKVSAVVDATTESGFRVNYTGRTSNLNIQADGADNLYARVSGGRLYLGTVTAGNDFFLLAGSVTSRAVLNGSTGNLLLGTTTDDGVNRLQVAGSVYTTGPLRVENNDGFIGNLTTGTFLNIGSLGDANNVWVDARGTGANVGMNFRTKGSGLFGWFNTTAGVSLMTLSNAGELSVRNQIPTIGSTSLVVRAGAGQSGNLQTWQDSAGAAVGSISASGVQQLTSGTIVGSNFVYYSAGQIQGYSALSMVWSGSGVYTGTKDLSLSRASAGTLQVGDGSANSNGTILARIYTWANGTEGTCDATLRGQVVMVQGGAGVADTFRVCRKDAANAYAWTALY